MNAATDIYRIEPATAERWGDVTAVMGTRGDPAGCWCQYFHLRGKAWRAATPADNRDSLRLQVQDGQCPPGVLAYLGTDVVGWCRVGPKASFPRLVASRITSPPRDAADRENIWAITCFVVPAEHRKRGIATALLSGAVDFAREHGADWVEGYPVETDGTRRPAADLFHGTVGQFEKAGFAAARRPSATRVVMHRAVR